MLKKLTKNLVPAPVVLSKEEETIFSTKSRTKNTKRKRSKKVNKQIQGKKFFLTFPQCSVDPKLALTRLTFKYPCIWAIVSQESHLDGTPHLHVVFNLKDKAIFTDPNRWDFIAMKHGNYQIAKHILKVVKYVTKDGNYESYKIDVPTWLMSHQTKNGASFELVASLMKAGNSLEQIDDLHPGMVARNLVKLQKYDKFLLSKKRKLASAELKQWRALDISALDQDFRLLGIWMNNNLHGSPRLFKQKQLWLWGNTNLGKTSMVMKLMKYFRTYMIPTDVSHLDDYHDDDYDLLVMDEYKGQKSITWLNGFAQGSHFPVHRRYSGTMKIKNLPLIVLSNYSIEQAYDKVNMYNPERLFPLKSRFEVINVLKFIDLKIK